jgi:DNA segregation ATPase FtsK/SpoIIIE, S-DNA-T family
MALAGILGDHKGSVAREVLITLDEWEEMKRLEQQVEAEGTLFEGDDEEEEYDEEDGDDEEEGDDEDEDDEEYEEVPAEFDDEYRR